MPDLTPRYFDDLTEGHRFTGSTLTITEAHVVNYASFSGDFYKLHMDAEAMKLHPFGQRIAHGPLTVSLAMGQLAQRITHENWQVEAAISMTDFRFTAPVFIGDTLGFQGVIGALKERKTNGFVPVNVSVANQRGEEILTGSFTLIVAKRKA